MGDVRDPTRQKKKRKKKKKAHRITQEGREKRDAMAPASSLPILVMHPFYISQSSHINWIFDISRSHLQTTTPPQFAPSSCGFSNQSMYNPCTRTQLVQTRKPLPDSVQDEQVGSCTSSSCLGGHEQASSTHDPVRASRPFHHQGRGPATLDVNADVSVVKRRPSRRACESFVCRDSLLFVHEARAESLVDYIMFTTDIYD